MTNQAQFQVNGVTKEISARFAKDLIDKMYREHGIDHHPTVCKRMRGSYQHTVNGLPQIVLGWANLDITARKGFEEWKSIAYIWDGQGDLRGLRGIWAIAVHEFAHVVQELEEESGHPYERESNGRKGNGNKYHNLHFCQIVEELQILYPFEEAYK